MEGSVKIDIIGGFLGAGKTTFINKLLADGLAAQRIALIENEFGKEAIDNDLIQTDNFEARTLASGCICCTLKSDFITSISDIVNTYRPDRIVIEPTGLAGPDELEATCTMSYLQERVDAPVQMSSITTIVDATDVAEMVDFEIPVYLQQLEQARFIVLSHTQEVSAEGLSRAHEAIARIAKRVVGVCDTPWDELDGLELLELSAQAYAESVDASNADSNAQDDAHGHNGHEGGGHGHDEHGGHDHSGHAHQHGHAGFSSTVLHPEEAFDEAALSKLTEKLSDQGILRAKGFLHNADCGMTHFEFVNGRSSATPSSYAGDTKLVVIGRSSAIEALTL
ncbi:MAG: GTP-binding protein [Eggerthellaceae bacterium]|nr:GTP-binding protein [Eggerthellaceae bacterium]